MIPRIALFLFPLALQAASFPEIARHFERPPIEYSTAPLWVWSGVVTQEKIERDLRDYKAKNIHQVFVHARPGLITEYLSEEWFDLWEYTVELAKELDMNVWIYDENMAPSGYGGGHVAREMPSSVSEGNALKLTFVGPKEMIRPEEYDLVIQSNQKNTVLGGSLANLHEETTTAEGESYGFVLRRGGPWIIGCAVEHNGLFGGKPYIDLLIPGVTETFLEVTMKGYEARSRSDFGKRVPGIFTDEPNIGALPRDNSIRWTPGLFDDFRKRWGYDLEPHLISLFDEQGPWKQVRHNYHCLLNELFVERWSKPYYQYTESRGLIWTGHYWESGWPSALHVMDNMALLAWHQMPGVDLLFNTDNRDHGSFGTTRIVKELSSVANQLGRQRAFCESYGAAGWDLSFADMKRLGDWQYVLGVNFLNQHLTFMDLKGRRKADFPLSFSYHAPYWKDYGEIAAYFHRLSYALTQGSQENPLLVLEPTTSAWMYNSGRGSGAMIEAIRNAFHDLVDLLEKHQIEYDLGSESVMEYHGGASSEGLRIGERTYRTILLPKHTESLNSRTFELLQTFLEKGGTVILEAAAPNRKNGVASTEVSQLFAQNRGNVVRVGRFDDVIGIVNERSQKNTGFTPIDPAAFGGRVHHMRRLLPDGQMLFWLNFSQTEASNICFQARGRDVSRLDPKSGAIAPFRHETVADAVDVAFPLAPGGSLLLYIHDTDQGQALPENEPRSWRTIETPAPDVRRGAFNSIALDYLDFQSGDVSQQDVYFLEAASEAYRLAGIPKYPPSGYNPWNFAVQYRTNVLDLAKEIRPDSEIVATFPFEVAAGVAPSSLQAVVEWSHLYDIRINGTPIRPMPGQWWLDEEFSVLDLTKHVHPGRNELQLIARPMHIHAEIEPVFIIGDFAAKATDRGFKLGQPEPLSIGSWKEQGLPMYSGSVSYSKRLEAEAGARYRVELGEWNGSVARVQVNGRQIGLIYDRPHVLEITPWLKKGSNEVTIEVVGTLQNLLGPHHGRQVPGRVSPWSWESAPKDQPTGNAYLLNSYGLFEDFEIQKAVTGDDGPQQADFRLRTR